jgi:hypothetical protein
MMPKKRPTPEPADDLAATWRRRNSIWPLILDVGLVTVLIGLILVRQEVVLIIGAVVALIGLFGWLREARKEYSDLSD